MPVWKNFDATIEAVRAILGQDNKTEGFRPRRQSRRRRFLRYGFFLLVAAGCLVLALFVSIQGGLMDRLLAHQVRTVIADTLGPDAVTSLEEAAIRIGHDGRLALTADHLQVALSKRPDGGMASVQAQQARLFVDPKALLAGRVEISSLEIAGVTLGVSRGASIDWESVRIDALDGVATGIFAGLDRILRVLDGAGTKSIVIKDARVAPIPQAEEGFGLDALALTLAPDGALALEGSGRVGRTEFNISGRGERHDRLQTIDSLQITARADVDIGNAAYRRVPVDAPDRQRRQRFGVVTPVELRVDAARTSEKAGPSLGGSLEIGGGRLTLGGAVTQLKTSSIDFAYVPGASKIELLSSSHLAVAASRFPFEGGIIDLSRLEDRPGRGMAIEVIVEDGRAQPLDSNERSLAFDAHVFARFLKFQHKLVFDEMAINSEAGPLFASAALTFGKTSPEISFAAEFDSMQMSGIKQLWPFWIAQRPREWVHKNLFGGRVANGRIAVFVPEGRLAEEPGRLRLGERQLQIAFDYENARLGLVGDIPPLRQTKGRFELNGARMDVVIDEARGYFPTGRTLDVENGRFTIRQTDARPIMADLSIRLAGGADAVGELVSYRPISGLRNVGYEADDFSGPVTADVEVRFGLVQSQNPPKPVWSADMRLDGVDLLKPFQGRSITEIEGTLAVDGERAVLDARASVDGAALSLDIVEPLGHSETARSRIVSGRLSDEDRAALAPGVNAFISGPLDLTLAYVEDGRNRAEIGLSEARLSVPGLGWTKAAGVPARAEFTVVAQPEETIIEDFALSGEGFGVTGKLSLSSEGIENADFSQVQLTPADDYSVSLRRAESGLDITVSGRSIDLRSLISRAKTIQTVASTNAGASALGSRPLSITANVARAIGFNGEVMEGFSARFNGDGTKPVRMDVRGVTAGGEAVVFGLSPFAGGSSLALNAGDAGAVARFTDVYGKLSGGVLDLQMSRRGDGPFAGGVRLHDFALIDESQLDALLAARAQGTGRSLNDIVGQRIDTTAMRFQTGEAGIAVGRGGISVRDGVLRGPQIGVSFEGTVRDANGNMNISGTLMPAYGLNRLFAEIPLFGEILGNGRDQGLLGITFKLSGPASAPQLTVNPISIIAPGIFRQIFEF